MVLFFILYRELISIETEYKKRAFLNLLRNALVFYRTHYTTILNIVNYKIEKSIVFNKMIKKIYFF